MELWIDSNNDRKDERDNYRSYDRGYKPNSPSDRFMTCSGGDCDNCRYQRQCDSAW